MDKMESVKTTVDIPEDELKEAMRHLGAKTKKEAVVTALEEFNRRRRIEWLLENMDAHEDVLSIEELRRLRKTE